MTRSSRPGAATSKPRGRSLPAASRDDQTCFASATKEPAFSVLTHTQGRRVEVLSGEGMKSVLWSASALLLCVAATPMKAAEIVQEPSVGIRLGVLTCRLDGGPGFVVVSSKAAQCEFRAANGEIDHY